MSEGTFPPNPPQHPQGQPQHPQGQPQYPQGQYPQPGQMPAPGAPGAPGVPQTGVPGAPPMGTPPPGYYPEPEKKRSKIWVILGILFLGLVIFVGGCSFLLYRLAAGPLDATNDYMALLDEQRFDEAYDALAPACQAQTKEDFVSNTSVLDVTGYSFTSVDVTNNDATTTGTIELTGNDSRSARFTLDKVDGDWMVCGFEFGPVGSGNVPDNPPDNNAPEDGEN